MEQLNAQFPHNQQQRSDGRFVQNALIALRLRRTWLVTVTSISILVLLCGIVFFVLKIFLSLISLPLSFFILPVSLVEISVFISTILLAKRRSINAYRKAVHNRLKASMRAYYPPEGAPALGNEQEQHLLVLGLPGSGKTSSLEYFLYETTELALGRSAWIPVFIQMKYFDGFFRHYQSSHFPSLDMSSPAKTLLAYLLDRKHEGSNKRGEHSQEVNESELPGIKYLRPYLPQLIAQGRIVFLCDGMNELGNISLSALIDGLRDPKLLDDCSSSLVALASLPGRKDEVIDAVLHALHNKEQRRGASKTLIQAGQLAVDVVGDLLWNTHDNDLKEEAQSILAALGEVTFPIIYKLAHDPQHLSDAHAIFMRMRTSTVAHGLLSFLISNDLQQIEIAHYLLSLGLDRDQRSERFPLTAALLKLALEHKSRKTRLLALTVLLSFNTGAKQREKMAELIIDAVAVAPEYHAEFMRSLLLLGNQAEEPLAHVIDASPTLSNLQLEAVGILSTLTAHPNVIRYVESLAAKRPFHQETSPYEKKTIDLRQQELGFRALGGLLAGGIYDYDELMRLQKASKDQASLEFYQVLLGSRNLPDIARLTKTKERLEDDVKGLERQVKHQERRAENAEARTRISEQYAKSLEDRAVAAERALANAQRPRP